MARNEHLPQTIADIVHAASAQVPETPKHTPGPWEWRGDQLYSRSAKTTLLRDVVFWNPDPGDKSLIAAAPELLLALKAMLEAVRSAPEMQRRAFVGLGIQVNAAIDKAEGRS